MKGEVLGNVADHLDSGDVKSLDGKHSQKIRLLEASQNLIRFLYGFLQPGQQDSARNRAGF